MSKEEFKEYILYDNPGFFKTRKSHISKISPNLLSEISNWIYIHNLTPLNFNDSLSYYLNNITTQQICKVCYKPIPYNFIYCSNNCKKSDIQYVISKTHKTLLERTGSISPLGSTLAKNKRKQTCLDTYGTEHPSSNNLIKEKIKNTNIETYKDPIIRNKISKANIKTNLLNNTEITHKRKQTNFNNTGEYTTLTSKTISKIKNTIKDQYNTTSPFQIDPSTKEKAKQGNIKHYSDKIKKDKSIQKRIQSNLDKFGCDPNYDKDIINKKQINLIKDLQPIISDKVLNYTRWGYVDCQCKICNSNYEISTILLRLRTKYKHITCTKCNLVDNNRESESQKELFNWLSTYIECEQRNKTILGRQELDIYIPSKNYAIEYNGIYWHSDKFKPINYHINKTNKCKEKGINLIHVWEDLWENKQDIVKGQILAKLNLDQIEINSEDCLIKEITKKEIETFLNENYLQGHVKGTYYFGLYYNDILVYIVSIVKSKLNYKILRNCSKLGYIITNGFSKLVKHIYDLYPGEYILTSDLCWGDENTYINSTFILDYYSKPNFNYFIKQKNGLKRFTKFNKELKTFKVYDCGTSVYRYINKN